MWMLRGRVKRRNDLLRFTRVFAFENMWYDAYLFPFVLGVLKVMVFSPAFVSYTVHFFLKRVINHGMCFVLVLIFTVNYGDDLGWGTKKEQGVSYHI